MVFKPVSCPGVFTRAYSYTTVPNQAAAKLHCPSPRPTRSMALPKSPPPPRRLPAPDPAWHRTSFRIPQPVLPRGWGHAWHPPRGGGDLPHPSCQPCPLLGAGISWCLPHLSYFAAGYNCRGWATTTPAGSGSRQRDRQLTGWGGKWQ